MFTNIKNKFYNLLIFCKCGAKIQKTTKNEVRNMRIGYMRVNPLEKNAEQIVEQFQNKMQIKRMYWEQVSVKGTSKPEFDRMMEYAREGDEIIVPEFARFSRDLMELVKMIERLNAEGIILISEKEEFNSGTEEGKFKFKVIKSVAEYEKTLILQRRREGIAIAKKEGKYKGYVGKEIPKDFEYYKELYYARETNVTEIANHYEVSRPTVYKWLKKLKEEAERARNDKIKEKSIAESIFPLLRP